MSERAATLLARLAARHALPFHADAPPSPRFVTAQAGLRLSYLDWGGDGEPILFLHGGTLTAHTWDLVCLALRNRFRAVALDLRGHGLSDWANDYSIEAHVSDVRAIVDELGWTRFHLVGMSLGGTIAGYYAALADTRAEKLVLVDVASHVNFGATAGMRAFFEKPIQDLSLENVVDSAIRVSRRRGRDLIEYRFLHMTKTDDNGNLAWRNDRRRPHDFDHILSKLMGLDALAPQMEQKFLLARGELSGVLTEENAADFARLFRQGSHVTIPDAGHNVQEDNPIALAAAISSFLSE